MKNIKGGFVVERFCPIIGQNTAIETKSRYPFDHNATFYCLNQMKCDQELGGCKNRRFNQK